MHRVAGGWDLDALHRAIKAAGSQQALADGINGLSDGDERIGQSAVSEWLRRGRVPAERAIQVATVVRFHITPHQLRPDLYPNPTDGLPPEVANVLSFEQMLEGMAEVLRPDERAALLVAFERGPQHAIHEIEALEVAIDVRAQLLAAAQAHEGRVV